MPTHRRSNGHDSATTERRERPRITQRNARTRPELTALFNASWQKSVTGIIEQGQILIAGKEELSQSDYRHWIDLDLKITNRTVQMLTKIAEHPVLSSAKFVSRLPASWGSLYEIAGLEVSERKLKEMLEDGTLHRDITRKEVKQLAELGAGPLSDKVLRACGTLREVWKAANPSPDKLDRLQQAIFEYCCRSTANASDFAYTAEWLFAQHTQIQARLASDEGREERRRQERLAERRGKLKEIEKKHRPLSLAETKRRRGARYRTALRFMPDRATDYL